MSAAEYLQRIAYDGPSRADYATLRALHQAHLLAVPFENLDVHLGEPIVLDRDALFRKIVIARRGGFCYELNGLFAWLLGELGFRVTLLSAGVAHESGGFGPEFDHLALRVDLDEPWLADVGFGDGFRDPLPLAVGATGEYELQQSGGYWTLLRAGAPQYRFTLAPRTLGDFAGMCRHHQTSPESSFTRERIATLATPEGRITLSGTKLIRTRGERRTVEILEPGECLALLEREMGIRIGRY